VRHLAHKRAAFWTLIYGVYAASCACAKFFTAVIEGVGFKCGYTDAVRQKVVDLLVRDHLSVYKVQAHLKEDFLLEVSIGFIYDCFQWAYEKIDRAAYWQWALANFSGALCIDEVHDCGRAILVATDPVNDFTVAFLVVPKNNQRNMNRFLDLLKRRGLKVRVAVTDGSRLYKQALFDRWKGLEHQLCLFHFLHDQMMDLLTAVRSIRKKLQVNPRRPKGRPSKRGRPRKPRRWRRDFLYDHSHLLVKHPTRLTREELATLEKLFELDPRLSTLRDFTTQLHQIFDATAARGARNRRTRLLKNRRFRKEPLLAKALKRLRDDEVFGKLVVSLSWHHVPRTSNHVERKNRAFRLVQKTRYKRRLPHMIKRAYWLHLARAWERHPLVVDRSARPLRLRRRTRRTLSRRSRLHLVAGRRRAPARRKRPA
jgi:transposase-like protein